MENLLIYCLKCPLTNEIRYIGQTRRGMRRKYEHRSKDIKKVKNHLSYWLNSLINQNLKPIFEVIEYVNNIDELNQKEKYWISYYKDTFKLCNLEKGGFDDKIISENHISKKIKGKKLEDIYGEEKAKNIREKTSSSTKGENNPSYGSKNITPEYLKKQRLSNSKVPLKIIDTMDNNKEYYFINSKEAAKFIGCNHGNIRNFKKNSWKIKRRYIIMDYENESYSDFLTNV